MQQQNELMRDAQASQTASIERSLNSFMSKTLPPPGPAQQPRVSHPASPAHSASDDAAEHSFQPTYSGDELDLHPPGSHEFSDDASNQSDDEEDRPRDIPTPVPSLSDRQQFAGLFAQIFPKNSQSTRTDFKPVSSLVRQSDKVEVPTWPLPPSLAGSLENLAGFLQGRKGDPVECPLEEVDVFPVSSDYFKSSMSMFKDSYKLKLDPDAAYQPVPPKYSSHFSQFSMPSAVRVDSKWFSSSEELARRAAIGVGQTESVVTAMVRLVEESGSDLSKSSEWEGLKHLLGLSLVSAQNHSVATAANFALVQRDMLLSQLALPSADGRRARVAPFTGSELLGPATAETVKYLKDKSSEEMTSGGRFKYFKTKNAFQPKVKQTLTNASNKSFRGRRQQQSARPGSSQTQTVPSAGSRPGGGGRARGGRGGSNRGRGSRSASSGAPAGRGRGTSTAQQ